MAIDRSGRLANNLLDYINRAQASQTGVDTTQLANIINGFLPTGEQLNSSGGSDILNLGVYKRFSSQDMVQGKTEIVTEGLWTGGTGSLTQFFTSSTQDSSTSGYYHLNVYNTSSALSSAEVQFAVAYGHRTGGGWRTLTESDDSTLPTKAIYSQYRNILLNPTDTTFTFLSSSTAGTHDSDEIYVINVQRARFREKMDPGNFQLAISGSSGLIYLIDDSGKKIDDTVGKAGRIFNVVSGSLNPGAPSASVVQTTDTSTGQGYGLFYPDVGIIVLNPVALENAAGLAASVTTTTSDEYNHRKLYEGIKLGGDFQARRTENISTSHYFVRLRNREFNFSNNPTFVTGSAGAFFHSSFQGDPKTYPTTIGLYNDSNELLAVAKLSQPIKKSFDRELLIRVKLDF